MLAENGKEAVTSVPPTEGEGDDLATGLSAIDRCLEVEVCPTTMTAPWW
jgi:hypothetical protein